MRLVAAVLLLSLSAHGEEGVEIKNERPWRGAVGVLSGSSGGYSYPILKASPYALAGLKTSFSGPVESLVMGSLSYTWLRSSAHAQNWVSGGGYGDLGRIIPFSREIKSAVFASLDGWSMLSVPGDHPKQAGGIGMAHFNLGNAWMWRRQEREASVTGDLRLEAAHKNMYSNYDVGAAVSGFAQAELARVSPQRRLSAGAQFSAARADLGLRPYAGYATGKASVVVAGEVRRSLHSFFPDSVGAGVEASADVTEHLGVGFAARAARERYSMDPKPHYKAHAEGSLSWDWTGLAKFRGARGLGTDATRPLPAELSVGGYESVFRDALARSPSFNDFVRNLPVRGTDDILAVLSLFTRNFNDNNYNDEEFVRRNVNNQEELYARFRPSFLEGKSDPILVCIGAAQFAASLAEALGRKAGLAIQASAVTVGVPVDERGTYGGHAVSFVKVQTPEYGIVIVDWGRLTPTRTYDTEEAFRVYQGLAGIPGVFHDVTDAGKGGRHVGYLYSQEGKLMLRRLTFYGGARVQPVDRVFNDAPDGRAIATARYLDRLRDAFLQAGR